MSDEQGTPTWRTALSIISFGALIIKAGIMFFSSSPDKYDDPLKTKLATQEFQQALRRQHYLPSKSKQSNDILYTAYRDLNAFSSDQKSFYKLTKINKDTLIVLDLTSKIKLNKNDFYQNNHDESLMMAIKTAKDLNVFVHDSNKPGQLETQFTQIKADKKLRDFKLEKLGKLSIATYRITKDKINLNGSALIFKDADYTTFLEFESNKLSKSGLRNEMLRFLSQNLIVAK